MHALGAEDIDVVRDHIDVCWASANKCLHAISGAGFLSVSPRTWQKIENIKARSYYLDLKRYRRYVEELAQTPFTPAVSAYFALDAALSEFLADGHDARVSMYRERNQRLRRGLANLGMAPLTRTGNESNSVVTCCVPTGVTFQEFYDALKMRGYIVYGCKDVLAEKFLQVANMGDANNGRHVMLAMRFKRDVAQHDHLVVTLNFFKRAFEKFHGVIPVACKPVFIGSGDAFGRVEQTFPAWVFTGPQEQSFHCLFGFLATGAARLVT